MCQLVAWISQKTFVCNTALNWLPKFSEELFLFFFIFSALLFFIRSLSTTGENILSKEHFKTIILQSLRAWISKVFLHYTFNTLENCDDRHNHVIYSAIQINDICFIHSASTTISHAKLEMISSISCRYSCGIICKMKNELIKVELPTFYHRFRWHATLENIRGNVSKISGNHTRYRQIGSKSTNQSPLAWRKESVTVPVWDNLRAELWPKNQLLRVGYRLDACSVRLWQESCTCFFFP